VCRQCCLRLSFGLDVLRTTAASTAFRIRHAAHGFRLVAQGHDERFNVALDIIPDAGPLERPADDSCRLDQCAGNGLEPIPLLRILERLPDGLEQGFKATLRVGSCHCRLEDGGKDFEGPSSASG
jgi:hypothetical protein